MILSSAKHRGEIAPSVSSRRRPEPNLDAAEFGPGLRRGDSGGPANIVANQVTR